MNRMSRLAVAVGGLALCSSSTTIVLAECSGAWQSEPSLMDGRQRARACTDANGDIYVIGGSANEIFATVEMLPFVGPGYGAEWISLPDMPVPRRDHAIACIDGFIYVIGGVTPDDGVTASVDRYDISSGIWETEVVPDLNTARVLHGVAVDASGRIWVVGGYADPNDLASVEVLDPMQIDLGWQEGPALVQARTGHGVSAVSDGKLYAIGGMLQGSGGSHLNTLEVLDINSATPQWELLEATLPPPVSAADLSVAGADDRIYILGGWLPGFTDRVLVFDPPTGTIEGCLPMSEALDHAAMTLGADGRIYRIGGEPAVFAGTTSVESLMTEPPDFEFVCRIVETPGNEERGVNLPVGLDQVDMGRDVYAEIWIRDSGQLNTGVTCSFADLDFTDTLVSCVEPEVTALFDLFQSGECLNSFIDELGGCQLVAGIGLEPEWARVAIVPFNTYATGLGELTMRSADTECSAFGRGLIPPDLIHFDTCSVEIVCPCSYDLDDNCNIAAGDFGLFAPCWSLCQGDLGWESNECAHKDFDCSGCVSGGDLGWFAGSWQASCADVDPMTVYPACRQCESPVYCSGGPASVAGTVASTMQDLHVFTRSGTDPVLLSLRTAPSRLVRAGDVIQVDVVAMDTLANSDGLTVVFTDVRFDQSQFEIVAVDAGETYTLFSDPQEFNGIIRGVGGATMEPDHGAGQWAHIATVELRALTDVVRPVITVQPSSGEALSRYGHGLVLDSDIRVLDGGKVKRDRRSVPR